MTSLTDKKSLNKTELISYIYQEIPWVSRVDIDLLLSTAMAKIISSVKEDGKTVCLRGFGTFSTQNRIARKGWNTLKGEPVDIPAKKGIRFKAAEALVEVAQ